MTGRYGKLKFVILVFVLLATGFVAGRWFERFIYLDICLDLGGGQNPGGYPICVLERSGD